MNLYFRLFLAYVGGVFSKRISTSTITRKTFRVWPVDLDLYRHMNNGRYFQIMDVARFEWLVKTGTVGTLVKHGWGALLGGGKMRFRRALKLFEKYSVTTELVCWDKRWYYLEHHFFNEAGKVVATGIVRAAFRSKNAWIRPDDGLAIIDPGATSPPMPPRIKMWLDSELDSPGQDSFSRRDANVYMLRSEKNVGCRHYKH